MNLDILSKYRTQLMGIAILLVMYYHMPVNWENFPFIPYILSKYAYIGVDIFILLSGLGIYFACKKENSKNFYFRRFMRIIPYSIPIIFIGCILMLYMGKIDLKNVLLMSTLLEYYVTGNIQDWYLSVILFFYLISPFLYRLVLKNALATVIFTFVIWYVLGLFLYRDNFILLTSRLPVFVLGIFAGNMIDNKRKIGKSYILISFIIGLILLMLHHYLDMQNNLYWEYYMHYMPFFFIVFPLCLFISKLLSFLKKYSYPVLSFFGSYSLVIYILHPRILYVLELFLEDKIVIILATILLTVLTAYFWQKSISSLLYKLFKYKI